MKIFKYGYGAGSYFGSSGGVGKGFGYHFAFSNGNGGGSGRTFANLGDGWEHSADMPRGTGYGDGGFFKDDKISIVNGEYKRYTYPQYLLLT